MDNQQDLVQRTVQAFERTTGPIRKSNGAGASPPVEQVKTLASAIKDIEALNNCLGSLCTEVDGITQVLWGASDSPSPLKQDDASTLIINLHQKIEIAQALVHVLTNNVTAIRRAIG